MPILRAPPAAAMPARLAVLALALTLAGCSGAAPPAEPAGGTAAPFEVEAPPVWRAEGVRVATLNAEFLFDGEGNEGDATFPWKGDPAKARAHRDDIAAVVRQLDADLVLLPESENQRVLELMIAESLADMGYTAHLVDGRDTFTGQDVGLLSRLPVEAVGRTDEQLEVGVSGRLYGVSKNLWARVRIGETPVTLIGVHFLARPLDAERQPRRETQAEVIRRLVEAEMAAGREVIALGDFNDFDGSVADRAGSAPISSVMEIVKRAGPGPDDDLVNVLGDVPQAERYTALYDRNRNERVEPGELSAIDHLLLSPALYARVREVRFVHSHDPLRVSDHFPIVVTLAE